MLALARKVILAISIALSQLGPYFQSASSPSQDAVDSVRLSRLEQLALANEGETTRSFKMETIPYMEDRDSKRELKASMRDWLIQSTIRADPVVRQAIGNASEKKRQQQDESTSSQP